MTRDSIDCETTKLISPRSSTDTITNVARYGTVIGDDIINSENEGAYALLRDEAYADSVVDSDEPTASGAATPDKRSRLSGSHFILLEACLFLNVFLAGFDSTVTASSYTVIGGYFNATNVASWITTSYLITSTAFQPLYGSFSDILGRRVCFLAATSIFALGCLGCGLATNIFILDIMRAISGMGGGGLITMSTVINSDIIPFKQRGMFQASQNVCLGIGCIIGASLGGAISVHLGWRWIFLLQVPICIGVVYLGGLYVTNQDSFNDSPAYQQNRSIMNTDLTGALLLVSSLSFQLLVLSFGGNEMVWTDWKIALLAFLSLITLVMFVVAESRDRGVRPIMPMFLLNNGLYSNLVLLTNVFAGMAAYGYLFLLPLFFQIVLQDDASKAGLRLSIPSLATPIGGLITGIFMSRYDCLRWLVRGGTGLMALGIFMVSCLSSTSSGWQLVTYLMPANVGQGMCFPGMLFTFMTAFHHEHHAVSTSLNYLFRNLGMVWGVSAVSAIVQNGLKNKLPDALAGLPGADQLIQQIRESIDIIPSLEPHTQQIVRSVYGSEILRALQITAIFALVSFAGAVLYGSMKRPNGQCRLTR